MSTNSSPITDQDLDRLADGELSPSEQRELLSALDTSPDGWRRCALAFVESQTLARELGGFVTEDPPVVAAKPAAHKRSTHPNWLALAATVMLAFTAGFLAHQTSTPTPISSASTNSMVAGDPTPTPPPTVIEQGPSAEELARAPLQRVDPPDADAVTFWTHDEQGTRRSLRAKLIDAEEMNQRLGVEFHSAVSPELRERFEQRGYRLESHQRFAPLNMDDDRVLVVPVEDMNVQPIPLKYL